MMRPVEVGSEVSGVAAAIKNVIDSGDFPGPRIYPSNAAISQTAGHGDFSAVYDAPTALGGPLSRVDQVGIKRALDAGVRSIEHGQLADEETVALIASKGAWLSTQPFAEGDHTFPDPRSKEKDARVCQGVDHLFTWARDHGARLAFGTDLLFAPDAGDRQSRMFARLDRYMSPVGALRVGTSGNAALLRMSGNRDPYGQAELGVVRPGAWADLLVVEGDPTKDLSLLADPERNLSVIVKDGLTYRNRFG